MSVGAAEAGSWGGGGGTGGISTEGLGACGGPSRVGVVAALGRGLAVLAEAESITEDQREGEKRKVREAQRVSREGPGFLHDIFICRNPEPHWPNISRVSFRYTQTSCSQLLTWEGSGQGWSGHSDGHTHTAAAAVLSAAAATATGVAASAASAADGEYGSKCETKNTLRPQLHRQI